MLQFWMAANKFTINPLKSQIIVIHPKIRTVIPKFSLSFGDTLIYAVKTTKYLGIEIQDQLNIIIFYHIPRNYKKNCPEMLMSSPN